MPFIKRSRKLKSVMPLKMLQKQLNPNQNIILLLLMHNLRPVHRSMETYSFAAVFYACEPEHSKQTIRDSWGLPDSLYDTGRACLQV